MPGYRFSVGTKFRLDGVTYEVTTLLADQQVNLEKVGTGEVLTESKSKLITAFAKGELEFVPKGMGKGKGRKQGEGGTQGQAGSQEDRQVFATLDQYPEYAQRVAQYRLEAIKPLVALGPAVRTRSAVRARSEKLRQAQAAASDTLAGFQDYDLEGGARAGAAKAKPPKRKRSGWSLLRATDVASLFRWLKLYLDSDSDIRSLVPALYRPSEWNRLPAEVDQAIDEVIRERYLVPEKTSVGIIYNLVAARIRELNAENPGSPPFKEPSRSTINRRIAALDPIAVYTARFGERAAQLRFRQYFEGSRPNLPQVRVEMDSTRPDLMLVDDEGLPIGRPWLTVCLDVYTRYPLGYCLSWESPSYLTVMQCLRHAILDKGDIRERYGLQNDWLGYGVPILLVTDRGKEYVGNDLVKACGLLGIELEYCPPRTPFYKGTVERGWRTWATQLFHTLPGTTFSNIAERGDYDSVGKACVRASDIDQLLHIYLIDIYAQQEHRTPEGPKMIPARAWERALADGWEPRLAESARQVRIALAANIERTVEHYGIDLFGLRYNCDELGPLRAILNGEKARIKYDASNLVVRQAAFGRSSEWHEGCALMVG